MPYILRETKAGNTLIIEKYYSSRYHKKGIARSKNLKETSEAQKKCNLRKEERKLTAILNANFGPDDWHIVLDYAPNERPGTTEEARENAKRFISKLKRLYKKDGKEMKYVEVAEFGKKGAIHHHMVLCAGAKLSDIRKKWPHGRVHFNPLDDTGEYSKLASYLLKYRKYWKAAGGKGHQMHYSRNLIRPEPKITVVKSNGYYETPRVPNGWYVAPDTEHYGVTEFGWPYMKYILVKVQERRGP